MSKDATPARPPTLGIDLGTAHLRAAVMVGGSAPEILQTSDGSHAVPAVVAFDKGSVRVGRAALGRAATRPETVIRGVKRLLGRSPGEAVVDAVSQHQTFGVERAPGGGVLLRAGAELHAPEEAAAALFRHLLDTAEQRLGTRPEGAVLTAPYWFGPRQRAALSDAARLAGLKSHQLMSEGTAIALSLASAEPEQRRIAIVDVGAGGMTASILEIGPSRVVLMASAGDPLGGGDDLDRGLLRGVLRGLHARFGEFRDAPGILEMVRQACEAMKHDLAEMTQATAVIPFLPVGEGIRMQRVTVDRERFDGLLQDTLARVTSVCRTALEATRLSPQHLAAVYATGGLANLGPVRAAVERELGEITSRKLDPDGAVALGAALHGGMLSGAVRPMPVVDVVTALSVRPGPGASRRTMPPPDVRTVPPPISDGGAPSSQVGPTSVGPVAGRRTPSRVGPAGPASPSQVGRAGATTGALTDPDAYRLELANLLAAVRGGCVTASSALQPTRTLVRGNDAIEDDDPREADARAEMVRRLATLWKVLGGAMTAIRQYRWEHPQTQRQLEAALHEIHEALAVAPRSVRFEVTAHGLAHHGAPVWQPDRAPLADIPRQLFADGLRKVQLKQGLTMDELCAFVGVLVRDAGRGFGADDDTVTALWGQRFEHIAYHAVDAFIEGDDAEVEARRDRIAQELAVRLPLADDALDGARVALHRAAVERAVTIALPEATRARLAQEATPSVEAWTDRWTQAFPAAWREAERVGDTAALLGTLDAWSAEQVAAGTAEGPFAMLRRLTEAFAADDPAAADAFSRAATGAMFPSARVASLLEVALNGAAVQPEVQSGLPLALGRIDDDGVFAVALDGLGRAPAWLRPATLGYVLRWASGHEVELAALVRGGAAEDALAAMRRLSELGTHAAERALQAGFDSPHIEARLFAVMHLPDAPADMVRAELTRVLEDPSAEVRLQALRVVSRLGATAAGPVIVWRIQSPEFHHLPVAERRALLATLATLNPGRAESVAIELLSHTRIIPSQAAEESRRIAAEMLAETTSDEALAALLDASKWHLGNTGAVREAAARAAGAVTARRSSLPPPPARDGGSPGNLGAAPTPTVHR